MALPSTVLQSQSGAGASASALVPAIRNALARQLHTLATGTSCSSTRRFASSCERGLGLGAFGRTTTDNISSSGPLHGAGSRFHTGKLGLVTRSLSARLRGNLNLRLARNRDLTQNSLFARPKLFRSFAVAAEFGSDAATASTRNFGIGGPGLSPPEARSSGETGDRGPKRAAPKTSYLKHGFFLALCSAAGVMIAFQDEVISWCERTLGYSLNLDELSTKSEDLYEDSNDFFLGIADYFFPAKPEPWLLDFETLNYPAHLPTLVINLDKVVCKLIYDRHHGWQVKKRPGADRFFAELQHYYEIVVFSDENYPVAQDVLNQWQVPAGGVLHREFSKRRRMHYVKDISKLGRNLERTIHIDWDPVAMEPNAENGIPIKSWEGKDENDHALEDLIDFLKAAMHEQDVRKFIKKYGNDEDCGRRYLLEKQEREEMVAKRRSAFSGFGGGRSKRLGDTSMPGRGGGSMRF